MAMAVHPKRIRKRLRWFAWSHLLARARDVLGIEQTAEAMTEGSLVSLAPKGQEQLARCDEPMLVEKFEDPQIIGLKLHVADAAGRKAPRLVFPPCPTLRQDSSWGVEV
jgi:hypothetical protein